MTIVHWNFELKFMIQVLIWVQLDEICIAATSNLKSSLTPNDIQLIKSVFGRIMEKNLVMNNLRTKFEFLVLFKLHYTTMKVLVGRLEVHDAIFVCGVRVLAIKDLY